VIPLISDKRRVFESIAVLLTAFGKFLFMDILQWRLPFILVTLTAWSAYAYMRQKSKPAIAKYWGFRTDNFLRVLRRLAPFAMVAIAACVFVGHVRSTLNITWHIIPLLFIYPLWGTTQQYLCVCLVAGNLNDMTSPPKKHITIAITSGLFAFMHYPDRWLMAGTFVLALLYCLIYLRERNLFALGLFHGWLGAIFYYTVVGRDPFMETFGKLFRL
jgi:uncharacterized protein